jgi:hypothetical protein
MIEKIKAPVKRALQHPRKTGALLVSSVALIAPAVQATVAQAEGSQTSSALQKLAKQTERVLTEVRPVVAATGTVTISRKTRHAGSHNTVYDHIAHPLVVQYRSLPQPVGFLPGPNQEDIEDGEYAFGTMTIKNHKPIVTFFPYNPNTMTLSYPGTGINEPDQGLTTEDIVFYKNGNSPYQDFTAPLLADNQGNALDIASEPDGQPQRIGHLTTTLHP